MVNVNVTEQHNRVIVQEDGTVRVVSVAQQGPPGAAGPPGELEPGTAGDMLVHGETEWGALPIGTDGQILATVSGTPAWTDAPDADTTVYDEHLAATEDIHGIASTAALETQAGAQSKVDSHAAETLDTHGIPDTTQLATQDDLENIDALPDGTAGALLVHGAEDWSALPAGDDTHVLTLADGSPTWAAPEGGGGLDPDGAETITGDWHFDRENLRVGDTGFSIGLGASKSSTGVALGNQSQAHAGDVAIGRNAGFISVGGGTRNNVLIGGEAGRQNNAARMIAIGRTSGQSAISNDSTFIGRGAGRNNNRHNRLIIDTAATDNGNLVDPLIDGRFRDGTDSDSFEYSKGVKVNGHLEATDQLILHSPDGTRWAITVDDSGNLSTTEATEAITP